MSKPSGNHSFSVANTRIGSSILSNFNAKPESVDVSLYKDSTTTSKHETKKFIEGDTQSMKLVEGNGKIELHQGGNENHIHLRVYVDKSIVDVILRKADMHKVLKEFSE